MLQDIISRIISTGSPATVDEALELNKTCATGALCEAADSVRRKWCGNAIHTCSIVNARSGKCGEDCKWCAQSAHHSTGISEYDCISLRDTMDAFNANRSKGVKRFSLVTSGRSVATRHMKQFCDLYRELQKEGGMDLCASMGLLSREQLRQLRDCGVTRYHCNLETSASYFPTLCSTHTTRDKLDTIRAAREVGMEVCCGGIIGMGESMRDRLELAQLAREAGAVSIPVNILQPIKGTPLENVPLIEEDEIIRSIALMRLMAPKCVIHFAGGRARLSHDTMARILRGGANGALVGDMLTTIGNKMDDDYRLFEETGYDS